MSVHPERGFALDSGFYQAFSYRNKQKANLLFAVFQDFRIKKLSGIDSEILRLNDVAFLLFIDNQLSLCKAPVLCS